MTKNEIFSYLAEKVKSIALLSEAVDEKNYKDDLLLSGMLDSFGFIQFISSVENKFKFDITEDEQLDERIRSIDGMVYFIIEKAKFDE